MADRPAAIIPRALAASRGPEERSLQAGVLIAVRMCLLAIALLTASLFGLYFRRSEWNEVQLFYPAVALLFGFCALSGIWILWRKTGPLFTYIQFTADVAIVTAIIQLTGGAISPCLFLYLPLVMGAAVLASRLTALVVALTSLAAYGCLLLAASRGWLAWAVAWQAPIAPARGYLIQFSSLALALVLVAFAASYLRRRILAGHNLAQQSQRALEELNQHQRTLIEGLPTGVITTTAEGVIVSINQAALELLRIARDEAEQRRLSELLREVFPGTELEHFALNTALPHEVEVMHRDVEQAERILLSAREIAGQDGQSGGRLYIFEDITKLRSIEGQLALQERMAQMLSEKHRPSNLSHPKLPEFVGESQVMRKVFQLIEKVGHSEANVLISGESGTGKELAARAIHLTGARGRGNFVAINCGAVPENLIESELFGHKKGAFTGADSDHSGLFRAADGGTIFLDEIGELPLQLQAKLLRAIQQKTIRPVGSEREIPVNVRIISATNRNLKREVEQGKFREDLYYRLHVVGVHLPPLRDRKEDIPLLVNSLLKRLLDDEVTPIVPPATMQILMNHLYPGNVRELENLLERALVLGGEVILPEHLPEQVRRSEARASGETTIIVDEDITLPTDLDQVLASIERKYLEVALVKTNGAKKQAARLLGINFRSLRYRLQKFGMGE